MVYDGKYFHTSSSTVSSRIKPKIQLFDGKVLLDEHPRKDGIKAAIEYLKTKRKNKVSRKPLDWHICIEMLDVSLTVILIALLISVIIFK